MKIKTGEKIIISIEEIADKFNIQLDKIGNVYYSSIRKVLELIEDEDEDEKNK